MNQVVYIYSNCDPRTGAIRYIGMTKNLKQRLWGHISAARRGVKTHHANWIRSLLAEGLEPVQKILTEVPADNWEFWEREYIKLYRELGCDLTNGTDGGEGGDTFSHNPNQEEIRENMSKVRKGKPKSPETRARMSGKKHSPEFVEKRIFKLRGKKRSSEVRAKMSAAWTPERRAALAERNKSAASIKKES